MISEYLNLVYKYWQGYKEDKSINKIAEVCMHAGYSEQDVAELCETLGESFSNHYASGQQNIIGGY